MPIYNSYCSILAIFALYDDSYAILFFNFAYFETIESMIWQDKVKHLANQNIK